jgi:hypothetical protein
LQQNRERWLELSQQIAIEQDPDKFHEMVTELNRLLAEKENRLKTEQPRQIAKAPSRFTAHATTSNSAFSLVSSARSSSVE